MASTDSSFVGHIHDGKHTPETYLAAAVLSDMMVTLVITPPLAFNQVVSALVGQAMGSNNPKIAGIWLQQSMFWLSISMAPCLIGLFYVQPFLELLGFPADISAVAGQYAKWNLLWPIPNGLYQCLRFYFQACGHPRPAMYNNLIFLGINALLNWIFVMGGPIPGWNGFGFIGAAISLSISRTMQGVCYFIYMFLYRQHHKQAWPDAGWSMSHHTRSRTWEFLKQSLPNVGTLLFQAASSQATTVLVGRLGELPIAASSALSTVTIPWAGTLSATCGMVSGVRVGYHLGRGNSNAARQAAWLVIYFITAICVVMAIVFVPLKRIILNIATDDEDVIQMATTLVIAMLFGTWLNLIVGNVTSGVFSGQGRPLIATILSFGLELPMSIGGVAIYILLMHGNLLGVYWWGAISGGIEASIVVWILFKSNWGQCAEEARQRQETPTNDSPEQNGNATDPESSLEQSNDTLSDDDAQEGLEAPLIMRV
jgi:multidrug resistance protein, MATE family